MRSSPADSRLSHAGIATVFDFATEGDHDILVMEFVPGGTLESRLRQGPLPLVQIQNAAVPFEYVGTSEVESLMPLQDELNTRLSDRAHRITMQSFKMYLGKGIDNFGELPVAPGRMWMTDNDNAEVIEFGGDSSSPSEDAHIREIREASATVPPAREYHRA